MLGFYTHTRSFSCLVQLPPLMRLGHGVRYKTAKNLNGSRWTREGKAVFRRSTSSW
jgi:hypothetical protein